MAKDTPREAQDDEQAQEQEKAYGDSATAVSPDTQRADPADGETSEEQSGSAGE